MSKVITFEEELEQVQAVKTSIPTRKPKKLKTGTDEEAPLITAKKKEPKDKHQPAADKLMYDANMKLNYYLKKSPQFQIIDNQINILNKEAEVYKNNGSLENYEKTRIIVTELAAKRKELKTIFKTGDNMDNAKNKKEEINNKIKNSEEIKTLNAKKLKLQKEIKDTTPSYLVGVISKYRKQLQFKDSLGLDSIDDEIIDFEDELDTINTLDTENTSILQQEYYDFCGKIADILDWTIDEVIDSTDSQIRVALQNAIPDNTPLKDELKKVNQLISNEKAAISGSTKITDLMFDIFDFKNDETEGKVPKEILAASNISLVKI